MPENLRWIILRYMKDPKVFCNWIWVESIEYPNDINGWVFFPPSAHDNLMLALGLDPKLTLSELCELPSEKRWFIAPGLTVYSALAAFTKKETKLFLAPLFSLQPPPNPVFRRPE